MKINKSVERDTNQTLIFIEKETGSVVYVLKSKEHQQVSVRSVSQLEVL